MAGRDWWHAIEVAPGVVTPGPWDLRAAARRMPWPAESLAGFRCLDIGTMDGFWAFEMEARGAAEVVATDVPNPRHGNFEVAKELRGSRVEFYERDVYELDPARDGQFDLVFMGYVLAQALRDPIGALERIRGVCRGSLIVLDTVSAPLALLPAPLARVDARRDGGECFVFNPRGLRKALDLSGWRVEARTGIFAERWNIDAPGVARAPLPVKLMHWFGIRGRSVAMRARPVPFTR